MKERRTYHVYRRIFGEAKATRISRELLSIDDAGHLAYNEIENNVDQLFLQDRRGNRIWIVAASGDKRVVLA